jgi:hypothetical protein
VCVRLSPSLGCYKMKKSMTKEGYTSLNRHQTHGNDNRIIKLWCCEEKGNGISMLPSHKAICATWKKNLNETFTHINDFLATTMVFTMSHAWQSFDASHDSTCICTPYVSWAHIHNYQENDVIPLVQILQHLLPSLKFHIPQKSLHPKQQHHISQS